MGYTFDKVKMNNMLKDFYTISKITMSVWDADFNQLTFYPSPMASICTKIKSCPRGKQQCLESDIAALKMAAATKKEYTFTCHAGLVDTVVPISYNDEIIAYIMFGQIRDTEGDFSQLEKVKSVCAQHGMRGQEVEECYEGLPVLNKEQISAVINLFKMCIPYFYISEAIKKEENLLASEINNYIETNISSNLSVSQLSKHFRISVNELYQISHKFFGTTIKEHIIQKRIDKAKHYLTTTNFPISSISVKVGYQDYNYFIRTFKARVGCTPLVWRKKFPFNLV